MKIVIKYLLIGFFLMSFSSLMSQDIHFSQFFANPISYNPANTGFFRGNYRLGVNHKEQWPWAVKDKNANYNTSSAYADFTFLDKKFNKVDWAGIGINYINDKAGDGVLRSNKLFLALAYHKGLDRYHKHFISLGFTVAYINKAINFRELYFNNQWRERLGFVKELPNYENLSTEDFTYFDLGFGIQGRNNISKVTNITYGFTLMHVNTPYESFYEQLNKIGIRYLAHFVVNYKINAKFDFMGSSYFTFQKESFETLFGATLGVKLNRGSQLKTSKLIIGTFYRWNDAFVPILGYQFDRTRILMNYDVNLSKLTVESRGAGGIELSITHVGFWNNKLPSERKMNCYDF